MEQFLCRAEFQLAKLLVKILLNEYSKVEEICAISVDKRFFVPEKYCVIII